MKAREIFMAGLGVVFVGFLLFNTHFYSINMSFGRGNMVSFFDSVAVCFLHDGSVKLTADQEIIYMTKAVNRTQNN